MTIPEVIEQLKVIDASLLEHTRGSDTTHNMVMKIAAAMGKIESAATDLKELIGFPEPKRLPGK